MALSLFGLVRKGGKLPARPYEPGRDPAAWPKVTIIVPADGCHPAIDLCLNSLLDQDYPSYEVIIVTADQDRPAVPFIIESLKNRTRARHVVSGRATRSGQKNHNLLAGIESASPDADVLVFCDAGRIAPRHFLKALIRPIALGRALVSSGYHHLAPQKATVSTLGRAATILILYLTRSFKWLVQPWGGATAIRRSTFEALKVRNIWAENVVDDVSLSALLNKYGLSTHAAPAATLITPLAEPINEDWTAWLTRQLQFLKFCQPKTFLGAGIYTLLLAITIIGSGAMIITALGGLIPLWSGLPALLFLLFFIRVGLKIRSYHPKTFDRKVWLSAFFCLIPVVSQAFTTAVFTRYISWANVRYRVGRGGRIISITWPLK